MANYYYVFTENFLYDTKNKSEVDFFLEAVELNLDNKQKATNLFTIEVLKKALLNLGLEVALENLSQKNGKYCWSFSFKDVIDNQCDISVTDLPNAETSVLVDVIAVDYNPTLLNRALSQLNRHYGIFIEYCDSGEVRVI